MLLAYSSGVAPPLATAELLQSNGSVHHPVATGVTAVTAARLVRTRVRTHGLERSDRPVKGSMACVCFGFFFSSMETLSLIQRVSAWTSKASSEIVYVNELIKE